MLKPACPESILEACALLRAGKLVALPTETVYGLAADAFNAAAVEQIFKVKGRPSCDPLIVHIEKFEELPKVAALDEERCARRLERLKRLWPGPLSVILPRHPELPGNVSAGLETVAVRIPAHPVMREVLRRSGLALACPSANPFAYVSPTCAQHVEEQLGSKIDLILDGGSSPIGLESSVVSILGPRVKLLRPGAVALEQLEEALGEKGEYIPNAGNASNQALPSPGMLEKHYAPQTPLRFVSSVERTKMPPRVGRIAFAPLSGQEEGSAYAYACVLSSSGSLDEVAKNLFAALRQLDQMKLDLILVDSCPEEGIGVAIMDRLRRAIKR